MTPSPSRVAWHRLRMATGRGWAWTRRAVFGDRIGVLVFCGAVLLSGLIWDLGFAINDNVTVANALVAVADGHLYFTDLPYMTIRGPATPGTHFVDGRVYGRNYGHVILALPVLWLIQASTTVTDIAVLLPAVWSALLVAGSVQVGALSGRRRFVVGTGCGIALLAFGLNIHFAQPLNEFVRPLPLLALQTVSVLAAALTGVFLYRLLARSTRPQSAGLVAAAAALATPIAFWGPNPKRHALVGLYMVLTLYTFTRSRDAATGGRARAWRAVTYGWVGLTAWVHAAEGLILLTALLTVDLLTARSNSLHDFLAVGAALLLSLIPFLLTNMLISGNPLRPPRTLPQVDPGFQLGQLNPDGQPPQTPNNDATAGDQIERSSFAERLASTIKAGVSEVPTALNRFAGLVSRGWTAALDSQAVGWGYITSGWPFEPRLDNLAILEGSPFVTGLAGLAVHAVTRIERATSRSWNPRAWSPSRQTDLLAIAVVVLFSSVYLGRIPVHAMFTTRYLHPVIPVLCYGVGRVGAVRTLARSRLRTVLWTYAGGVLIGGQLVLAVLYVGDPTWGDAIALHAIINIVVAGLFGGWTVAVTIREPTPTWMRVGAVLFGLTLAGGSLAVLFITWNHALFDTPVLPIVRFIPPLLPPN